MDAIAPLLYALIKAVAYMSWCGQGARLHDHRDRLWMKGIVYGFVRLAMGVVFGLFLIFWLVNVLSTAVPNHILLYLAVYVPVRWLEWSLMAVLMDLDHRSVRNLLWGETSSSRLWRLGGIVISCLADIPMMISMGGLPLGRFMC
jgi:hypothetical protein